MCVSMLFIANHVSNRPSQQTILARQSEVNTVILIKALLHSGSVLVPVGSASINGT